MSEEARPGRISTAGMIYAKCDPESQPQESGSLLSSGPQLLAADGSIPPDFNNFQLSYGKCIKAIMAHSKTLASGQPAAQTPGRAAGSR